MADPTKYVPSYSFTGFQSESPADPLPANQVDAELADVADSLSETIDAVKNIRRSDGALKNGVVTPESLSSATLTLLALASVSYRGVWLTATAYTTGQYVSKDGILYLCVVAHTSGVFATDEAAGKWALLSATDAASIGFAASGSIAATNVQAAIEELDSETTSALSVIAANSWVTTARINDSAVTAAKLAAALDLSSKTVTLPAVSVTAAMLAAALDLSSKTVTLPATSVTAAMLAATLDLSGKTVTLPSGATGTTQTASDNSAKIATTAYVDSAIAASPFSETFISSDQTITAAGALTLAHGFSARPYNLTFYLVCQTGEAGYSAGDVVMTGLNSNLPSDRGFSAWVDTTNINIRFCTAASTFQVLHKTTGVAVLLTNANWRLRVVAWA